MFTKREYQVMGKRQNTFNSASGMTRNITICYIFYRVLVMNFEVIIYGRYRLLCEKT